MRLSLPLRMSFVATINYIRDDETFLPKVGVVTIAGLGGLLLGHRGGALRKTFYSSVAATVALSACYPKQSSNLLDQVCLRIKNRTKLMFDSKYHDQSMFLSIYRDMCCIIFRRNIVINDYYR
jgi:hypothetical protein